MKKNQENINKESGILILIGALIIIVLAIAILFIELYSATGTNYTINVTIVIPFIALAIAFITWKNYFFPKKDDKKIKDK